MMSDSHSGFGSDSPNQITADDRSLSLAPASARPLDEGIGHSLDCHVSV